MKICHIADIHIRNLERHDEYNEQFNKLYKLIKKEKVDIVTIVGDLFDNFIEISNEAKILAGDFLNKLSNITDEVIVVLGNHDLRKKNLNRTNSIEATVKLINNPKIVYLSKSDFYDDKLFNIVWVNHSHAEKNINPWDNKIKKDKTKTYIDLFHDPINGCSTDTGMVFENKKYRSIKDFKGDIALFGDIHKHQHFRKNETAAYSSSLVQQDFGENVEGHGCIIWDIKSPKNITYKFHNIKSEYTQINLHIDEGDDYDNLNLTTSDRIGKFPKFKIHWKDLSSNINSENERKIRAYVKNKYNINKVKFDKTYIYTDVLSSKMLSESLDLTDKSVHRKIFKEYLSEQGYSENDIIEILEIDDIINDRLEIVEQKTNIEWKIEKIWFNNFKGYGDDNNIDWSNLDGIIQIHGINQQGKTTILDAISYILYGTTTTTDKREKYGDNRYINNKRNLDFCDGGAVINIDGEKITLLRKTERVWNRNKTKLTSCSTTLDYYNSEIIKPKNKLTGERKTSTQKTVDLILGNFKDFVRLSLTNADNLNDLLSADRSTFMDSIIRDAGYDIFEKKLKEYKDYKKSLNEEKLVINIQESEEKIKEIQETISEDKILKKEKNGLLKNEKINLELSNKLRDDLIKKLNKVDESMQNFDVSISNDTLDNYNKKISDCDLEILIQNKEIEKLPTSFDSSNLEKLKLKLKNTNDKISKINGEISQIYNNNTEIDSKIDKVKNKLRTLRDKEIRIFKEAINDKEKEISDVNSKRQNIINLRLFKFKDEIKKIELEKIDFENNIKNLKKDGTNLKTRNDEKQIEIEELKNSDFCPACGRDYDESTPEHLEHIQSKIEKLELDIEDNNLKIKKLIVEYKKFNLLLPKKDEQLESIKTIRDKLLDGVYDSDMLIELKNLKDVDELKIEISEIGELIERLNNNDLSVTIELETTFNKGKTLLKKFNVDKKNNLNVIENLTNELKLLNIDTIEDDIYQEEKIKDAYDLRKEKLIMVEKLVLNIDNFNLKIKNITKNINKYREYESQIIDNKIIQSQIVGSDDNIIIIKDKIGEIYGDISNIEKNIALAEKDIDLISVKIKKYLKQKKQEELYKEYQRCISRDGIPTFLLKKSIHLINKELNYLLNNVDFTLFFDDNLILKLSMDDRLDVTQNAIESSGKERTFCALTLKIALRQINVKSRPNFIILDEITGKLIENSILEFIQLLDVIKTKIDKIIIIEHINPINYDGLITVHKDDELISSLTTDF